MEVDEVKIDIYDKRERSTSLLYVKKLSDDVYEMIDNDLLNCKLTLGTQFETRTNKDGVLEITRILKKSPFTTRRFFLNSQFRASDYRVLGDEIVRVGGFWQVDMGGIATINLPKDCGLDIDEIFKIFDVKLSEIIDDINVEVDHPGPKS